MTDRRDKLDSLILCTATLLPEPTRAGPDALAEQAAAARAAGFAGMSLWAMHALGALEAGRSADALRESVLGAGLDVPVVEALMPWDKDEAAALEEARETFELGKEYGARHAVAIQMTPDKPDIPQAAARLNRVAELGADSGIALAIEFLPWSGIVDLATTLDLIHESGRDDVGIMLDGFHWTRQPGGPCPDLLRSVPPERIRILQLCEAAVEPSPDGSLAEAMSNRQLPGDGVGDLPALLDVLDEMGATPLLAPEVFNTELVALGMPEMARRIYAATEKLLSN